MKKYLLFCVGLMLGCWSTNNVIRGPDGQDLIIIRCGGSWSDQSTCLEEASKVCPNGYVIFDSSGAEGAGIIATRYSISTIRTYHGNMLIRCN